MTIDRLKELLKMFMEGKDRSINWAKSVGTIIDEITDDDNGEYEELQDYLASYRPEGGEYLYDEKVMEKVCKNFIKKIEKITTVPTLILGTSKTL